MAKQHRLDRFSNDRRITSELIRQHRGRVQASIDNPSENPNTLTPVEEREGIWFKRDDAFRLKGVNGGKVRACLRASLAEGNITGITTCGARTSLGSQAVAAVGAYLGLPTSFHTSQGATTPELDFARGLGCTIYQHMPGYMSVVKARAREQAKADGWFNMPFGMAHREMVLGTSAQVQNLPWSKINRLVIAVGSGTSLAGILWGMLEGKEHFSIPLVLGIQVGSKKTEEQLDEFGPHDWRDWNNIQLIPSEAKYNVPASKNTIHGITLDPSYEAKTLPYLRAGDLLWIVGCRPTKEAIT